MRRKKSTPIPPKHTVVQITMQTVTHKRIIEHCKEHNTDPNTFIMSAVYNKLPVNARSAWAYQISPWGQKYKWRKLGSVSQCPS